jgi:CheY-like chemotaxis protein
MKLPESRIWLVVEDDENDAVLLQRALKRIDPDAKLQWLQDGDAAKDYLLGQNQFSDRSTYPMPFVILSDLKMPRCSGLELVQWIRQDSRFRHIPFVMFSSSDQQSDVALAYQDGANWYLAKPPTFAGLVEMLARLAENLSLSVWKSE